MHGLWWRLFNPLKNMFYFSNTWYLSALAWPRIATYTLHLLNEGIDTLVVASEVSQDSSQVFHAVDLSTPLGRHELHDQLPLDTVVLGTDARLCSFKSVQRTHYKSCQHQCSKIENLICFVQKFLHSAEVVKKIPERKQIWGSSNIYSMLQEEEI